MNKRVLWIILLIGGGLGYMIIESKWKNTTGIIGGIIVFGAGIFSWVSFKQNMIKFFFIPLFFTIFGVYLINPDLFKEKINHNKKIMDLLDNKDIFEESNWIFIKAIVTVQEDTSPNEAEKKAIEKAKQRILEFKGSTFAGKKSLLTQTEENIGKSGEKTQIFRQEEYSIKKIDIKEFIIIETKSVSNIKKSRHRDFTIYAKAKY